MYSRKSSTNAFVISRSPVWNTNRSIRIRSPKVENFPTHFLHLAFVYCLFPRIQPSPFDFHASVRPCTHITKSRVEKTFFSISRKKSCAFVCFHYVLVSLSELITHQCLPRHKMAIKILLFHIHQLLCTTIGLGSTCVAYIRQMRFTA